MQRIFRVAVQSHGEKAMMHALGVGTLCIEAERRFVTIIHCGKKPVVIGIEVVDVPVGNRTCCRPKVSIFL